MKVRVNPEDSCLAACHDGEVPCTVLMVDDHEGFRFWARALLEASGYEVVGEAEDGASALRMASSLRPELILVDIQLPDMLGFEVIKRLSRAKWRPTLILISGRSESDYGNRIAQSGAIGFIAKDQLSHDAISALLTPA